MPIGASAGTLDIENATLRSNAIAVLTNLVTGNDAVRSSGAPTLEVYGDPSNGGNEARLELVSNLSVENSKSFTRLTSNAGVFSIQSGTDGSTNGPITFGGFSNERLRITSDGNVGVGTDNPTGQLEVHGEGQTSFTAFNQSGNMGGTLVLRSDDGSPGSGGAVMFGSNNGFHAAIKSSLVDGSVNTRGHLAFLVRNDFNDATMSHVMTIADGGNVGIGTTNPTDRLDVHYPTPSFGSFAGTEEGSLTVSAGAEYSNAVVYFRTPFDAAAPAKRAIISDGGQFSGGGSGGLHFCLEGSSDNTTKVDLADSKMMVRRDGNVGIGTTDPGARLAVVSTRNADTWAADKSQLDVLNYNGQNSTYGMSFAVSQTYGDGIIQTFNRTSGAASYDLRLQPNGGSVGIGTTNPEFPLDVNGQVRVGDVLYIGKNDSSTTPKTLYFGGTFGDNGYDHSVIERRIWATGTENQELLLFAGNDTDPGSGSDRIRMKGNTILFDTYSSATTDRGAETTKMKIDQEGGLGLGTTAPDFHLTIKGAQKTLDNYLAHIYMGNDNGGWGILTDNTSAGANGWNQNLYFYGRTNATDHPFQELVLFENDTDNQTDTGVVSFTGQHRCFMENVTDETAITYEGLIVSANRDRYINLNGPALETGLNAIRVSESIPLVSISQIPKDKTCFGVISSVEDPETREERSGRVVSSFTKECGDTRIFVNSLGEGAIWVTNMNGNLESGDYITTSTLAGYGQKQDTEFLANYTVAKITMGCDFNPATQPVKRIKKELGDVKYWVKTVYESVSKEEYSNLIEENRTTTTETVYTNGEGEITTERYNTLETTVQSTYSELSRIIYQKVTKETSTNEQNGWELEIRQEMVNILNEYGQIQWEDDPSGATEKAYKIRYLDADGNITDEANHVYKAAFVGCTYHCG
jgi:hypothetical protein